MTPTSEAWFRRARARATRVRGVVLQNLGNVVRDEGLILAGVRYQLIAELEGARPRNEVTPRAPAPSRLPAEHRTSGPAPTVLDFIVRNDHPAPAPRH